MKECKFCGKLIDDDAKFCRFCGGKAEEKKTVEKINNESIGIKKSDVNNAEDTLKTENTTINTKNKESGNGTMMIFAAAIIIVLIVIIIFLLNKNNNQNNQEEIHINNIETTSAVETQIVEKTKYDVLNEVALAAKNFYLSYLNASNNKDKYLMENCTEKLRDERGEYMKVNEDYEFYNRKFIFDIGSLEYITEDGQEKAIFKVRTENDGYRYNDGSYVDNIRCLHIEAIKENSEWQMDFVNKIDPSLLSENVFEVE